MGRSFSALYVAEGAQTRSVQTVEELIFDPSRPPGEDVHLYGTPPPVVKRLAHARDVEVDVFSAPPVSAAETTSSAGSSCGGSPYAFPAVKKTVAAKTKKP